MEKVLTETTKEAQTEELQISAFGYELIREIILPDLLGEDSYQILYWAGKQLARKFPLPNLTEVIAFFEHAGWGQLVIKKETKNEIQFSLTGDMLNRRLDLYPTCHFQLEAGFLAEQCSFQKKCYSESISTIKKRSKTALFTVQWDPKDPII